MRSECSSSPPITATFGAQAVDWKYEYYQQKKAQRFVKKHVPSQSIVVFGHVDEIPSRSVYATLATSRTLGTLPTNVAITNLHGHIAYAQPSTFGAFGYPYTMGSPLVTRAGIFEAVHPHGSFKDVWLVGGVHRAATHAGHPRRFAALVFFWCFFFFASQRPGIKITKGIALPLLLLHPSGLLPDCTNPYAMGNPFSNGAKQVFIPELRKEFFVKRFSAPPLTAGDIDGIFPLGFRVSSEKTVCDNWNSLVSDMIVVDEFDAWNIVVRLASIIHPGADFIGWQDVDTWISFPRLYAFLRSIPEQGRPNAYIGLPQYMQNRTNLGTSILPIFSSFSWSCRPGSLFFAQGMLTFFGRELAKSLGKMEEYLLSFQLYDQKKKGSKCVAPSDVTPGFLIARNPFLKKIRIYATYSVFQVWPVYYSYKVHTNVAVHFLHRARIIENAIYYTNRTHDARYSAPMQWLCKEECSNKSWTICIPKFGKALLNSSAPV